MAVQLAALMLIMHAVVFSETAAPIAGAIVFEIQAPAVVDVFDAQRAPYEVCGAGDVEVVEPDEYDHIRFEVSGDGPARVRVQPAGTAPGAVNDVRIQTTDFTDFTD